MSLLGNGQPTAQPTDRSERAERRIEERRPEGEKLLDPNSEYFMEYSEELRDTIETFLLELDMYYDQVHEDSAIEHIKNFFHDATSTAWKIKDILVRDRDAGAGRLKVSHIYGIWNQARRSHDTLVKKAEAKALKSAAAKSGPKVEQQRKPCSTHLRKMACPTWDGTVRGYLQFRRKFYNLVEKFEDPEWSLARLQEDAITPGSREHILVRSRTTIHEAWRILDDVYGVPELVKDACLAELHAIREVSSIDDIDGLNLIVDTIQDIREDLEHVKKSEALGETGLAIVMTKVPDKIRRKVDATIIEGSLQPTQAIKFLVARCEKYSLQEQRDQMRRQAHGLVARTSTLSLTGRKDPAADHPSSLAQKGESQPGGTGGSGSTPPLPKGDNGPPPPDFGSGRQGPGSGSKRGNGRRNGSARNNGSGRKPPSGSERKPPPNPDEKTKMLCLYHPNANTHWTQDCRQFLMASAKEKKRLITTEGHCLKCFRHHKTETCRAQHLQCAESNCKNPKGHHTTLHSVCMTVSMATTTEVGLATEPKTQLQRDDLMRHLGRCTIRPSHPVKLLISGTRMHVAAMMMYDPGATLSQIVEPLAVKLRLKPVNTITNLMITTAGKRQPDNWGSANLYKVPLYDECGTLTQIVACVGVSYIGQLDNGTYEKVSQLFPSLNPKTLLPPGSGPIDILVGNNHAAMFPEKIEARGNVVWAQTHFGDILHGAHTNFVSIINANAQGMSLSSVLDMTAAKVMNVTASSGERGCFSADARSAACTPAIDSTAPSSTSNLLNSSRSKPSSKRLIVNSSPLDKIDPTFEAMTKIEDEPICYRCESCPLDAKRKEENRLVQVYKDCITYDSENKRFVCKMPWKEEFKDLPDNRPLAVKHMLSITRSAAKDPKFRNDFVNEFSKMIDAGILVPVSDEEDRSWKESGGRVWYICYFAVLNEASASTPLRVVMDPTIPFQGFIINSMWEKPPNLIPPIASLIVGFRENFVPFYLDFKKCYWTLSLELEESHLHRVVYNRLDADDDIMTYRMSRNSWGLSPAGSMCSVAMLQVAEMFQDSYPEVYSIIKNNLYVDDATTSTDSVEHALELARDIRYVMGQASFDIKHFVIGAKNLDRTNFSEDDLQHVKSAVGTEKVLGVLYHAEDDEISINARVNFSKRRKGARSEPDLTEDEFDDKFPEKFTKKHFLSVMASIYDPSGLCSAATILLKHEFGRICDLQINWNDEIPEGGDANLSTNKTRCKELIRTVYDIMNVRFDRCLKPSNFVNNPSLVIFCDSSQTSYAAVAFYNWDCTDGIRRSYIVMAKAKPFPKNQLLTIPRGEMMACTLGARIKTTLVERSSLDFERVFLITDSTIVLSQLHHNPLKYNIWTANKIDEIQRLTCPREWYHVSSELNVADDATRGLLATDMTKKSRWQRGETFMTRPFLEWPIRSIEEVSTSTHEECIDARLKDPRMVAHKRPIGVPSSLVLKSKSSPIDLDDDDHEVIAMLKDRLRSRPLDPNDSWLRAKRRIARMIHFMENLAREYRRVIVQKTMDIPPKNLNTESRTKWFATHDQFVPSQLEMNLAAIILVQLAQEQFPSNPVTTYASLSPIEDPVGIWRVQGRTNQAVDNPPILLPKKCALGQVLIKFYHGPQHSGADTTLTKMRQDFWLVDGRKSTNAFTSKCAPCKMLRKPKTRVVMAPKKPEQLLRSPVFQNVIIDLAGPYDTQLDRRLTRTIAALPTGKVWVLVIVCRASQAVHLETVEGYDTDNFLAAYQTFVDVRSKPWTVVADLGSQIVSAAGVMTNLWAEFSKIKVANHDPEVTEWTFVPSGSHADQAERLIRTFKKTMEAITLTRKPKLPKLRFQRLLYSLSNIMNDRPLAIGRNNTGKLDAERYISPNDLLLGRSSSDITPIVDTNVPMSSEMRKYTDILSANQSFLNVFWLKWKEQVVATLFPLEKWTKSGRQISERDIVIFHDSNILQKTWILGEVTEAERSTDGIVRKVVVRYKVKSHDSNYRASQSKFVTKGTRELTVLLPVEDRD